MCTHTNQSLEHLNCDIVKDRIIQCTSVCCDRDIHFIHYINCDILNTHIVEIKKKNNDVVHKL